MPLQQQKPYTPWTIAIIVAMFAAFVVFVFAATGVLSQTPQQQQQTVRPGCLAHNRCWENKPDASSPYRHCYRERRYRDVPDRDDPSKPVFDPSVVYQPADGKQPPKTPWEKEWEGKPGNYMTWKTGDRRFCAGINFCSRLVSEYYDGTPAVRYTQANCRR